MMMKNGGLGAAENLGPSSGLQGDGDHDEGSGAAMEEGPASSVVAPEAPSSVMTNNVKFLSLSQLFLLMFSPPCPFPGALGCVQ